MSGRSTVINEKASAENFGKTWWISRLLNSVARSLHIPWRNICQPDERKGNDALYRLSEEIRRIITVLLSLKDNPFSRNAKKLHGREGLRIRVGNYRTLYIVDDADKKVEVLAVADRKELYR